ncbi:HARBI1 family protein [Neolewinella antarctica]|uniref:DDE Tnp4 domain-containing protein n=1 Tax=Neolewinella antarctica TaxID=442734 RepID=A0ABX0XBG8_9BACT|nr:transposase family protein [Neolewinella antarctica]NJC26117.1 hypothetical protein [Neolewinella antarctica]
MLTNQTRPNSSRVWKGTVGLDSACFNRLVGKCEAAYVILRKRPFSEVLKVNHKGSVARLQSVSDLVFFTLSVLKSGIIFDYAAFIYQFPQSSAHRQFANEIELIHYVLDVEGYLPIRGFDTVEDFQVQFKNQQTIIIDAREQRIQRPQDYDEQRASYSGKKKGNTAKAMVISSLDRYIRYVSLAYVGSSHDYSLLKTELEPGKGWFEGLTVRLDLGYQGFATDYREATTFIPFKKPKGDDLTDEQKESNKALARERIYVEHSIGGIKWFDILSTVSRIHDIDLYDKVLASCAGLWNFFITR